MALPVPSSSIVILSSPAFFGMNRSPWQCSTSPPLSIRSLMGKLKPQTRSSGCTCAASPVTGRRIGYSGYRGPSSATTRCTSPRCVLLHFLSSTVVTHHPCVLTLPGRHFCRPSSSKWRSAMSSSWRFKNAFTRPSNTTRRSMMASIVRCHFKQGNGFGCVWCTAPWPPSTSQAGVNLAPSSTNHSRSRAGE
jgi:hypothetical protein